MIEHITESGITYKIETGSDGTKCWYLNDEELTGDKRILLEIFRTHKEIAIQYINSSAKELARITLES